MAGKRIMRGPARPSVRDAAVAICLLGRRSMGHVRLSSQGRVVPCTPRVDCRASAGRRQLSEADAVDIWIARWLRIRRKDLLARYGCDPRRLYEIWEEKRFAGSRAKALELFRERHPSLTRPRRLRTAPAPCTARVPPSCSLGCSIRPAHAGRSSGREQIRNICLDAVIEIAACSLYVPAGK